jgi:hypothetical protein
MSLFERNFWHGAAPREDKQNKSALELSARPEGPINLSRATEFVLCHSVSDSIRKALLPGKTTLVERSRVAFPGTAVQARGYLL